MSAASGNRRMGLSWAFASAMGGALMAVPWKLANEVGDPAVSTLLLLVAAAIGSSALQLFQNGGFSRTGHGLRRIDVFVATLLAVFTLAGNHLSAHAMQVLSPSLQTVLLRVELVCVALVAWIWLGERVELRFWLGTLVAVVGLVLMQGGLEGVRPERLFSSGSAAGMGAGCCFGLMAVTTRRYIRQVDPVVVNALRLWMSVAFWFIANRWDALSGVTAEQFGYCALAALAGPFLGRLALMHSARFVEARVSTLASLSTPVLTLVLAYLVLDAWPADHQLLGGVIMIAGIALPIASRRRRR